MIGLVSEESVEELLAGRALAPARGFDGDEHGVDLPQDFGILEFGQ